jgi:hypothetical protein
VNYQGGFETFKIKFFTASMYLKGVWESLLRKASDNIPVISTEGVKVCFNRFVSAKEGDSLLLEFKRLLGHHKKVYHKGAEGSTKSL